MALSFENLSRLVRSPNLLIHLQDLKFDGTEKIVSFQWLGPHFLVFLRYATKLCSCYNYEHDRFNELLKSLDDSASDCILYGEIEHYKIFLEIIPTFMQELKEFFTIQNLQQLSDSTPKTNELVASFIGFLVETIGELLNFGTDSSVLVSDQVKFLLKELESLLTFLGDNPTQCSEPEQNNIVTEIKAIANEAGFFLYSFFFTSDLVTATKMDLALSVLLRRIEIVEVKIKDHCVAVSKLPKTDVLSLFIVDSLLDDFNDLMNNKDDLSVTEKDQIRTLHKELMFSRSFLADIDVQQNLEIKECAIQLRDLAYEAEYIISLILVEHSLACHLTLYDFIQKNKLIWTELREIKVKCGIGGLQVAENPTEVSSQDKSVPMADEITVGFKDVTTQIASQLVGGPNSRQIISIVGIGGLGKTTIAKKLFNDSIVRSHFDKLAWCVVSQTYKKRELLMDILSSVSNLNRDKISEMEDEKMADNLYQSLKGLRYLIIMDDIWNEDPLEDLDKLFPDDTQGSRILFTSRLKKVASVTSQVIIEPPPMSQGECWDLLEQRVFKKERCPQELQDIGKQIASNCQGLPLLVVVIASVLSNMEKNISLWLQVATRLSSYISEKADNYISILKLSYNHLPIHLKPCFLYFSAFEEDKEIPVRKLLSLWIAEGFIEKQEQKSLEDVAEEYMLELINRSLLQVAKRRSDNGVKACTLHDLILDMCLRIAEEEKFILPVVENQFLISKHHHCLGIDQSSALSIIFDLKNIRILEFSTEYHDCDIEGIEIMPDLRYLEIPSLKSSIDTLQNLEFLLVKNGMYIPAYLLNMPKLRHLHVGSPKYPARFSKNCDSSQINSLQTLSFVFIFDSEDEEILRCSPNLRSLKCKSSFYHCPDLNFLTQLESLKMKHDSSFRGSYSRLNFPRNIKKLTLSEFALPREIMSLIGSLPNLEILKLEYAFEGEVWNTKDDEFQKLKFLKLNNLKFEQWNSSSDHFPVLERLVLRYCEKLKIIPSEFSKIPTLQMIEVYQCGEDVDNSALQIHEEQLEYGNEEFKVIITKATRYSFLE